MTSLTTPKGPLPARVYWTRRGLLLGVALLLVFGIARVLGGGSDASSPTPTATRAAASAPATTPVGSPTAGGADESAAPEEPVAETGTKKKNRKNKKDATVEATPVAPVPPAPTGVCANDDIVIAPSAAGAAAGGQVQFLMTLRTTVTPACTWQVSPDTITLKITSGEDDIWASRECPKAVPTQDVVVYRDFDAVVPVVWSGRRSDADCSRLTEWADPGWYHLLVATYAGEPVDVQFELGVPAPVTITKTVEPTQAAEGKNKKKADPAASPSGAVEPNGG